MLFDVIRDLNEAVTTNYHDGMPGEARSPFIGWTDGFKAVIQWHGFTVWDSSEWEFGQTGEAGEEQLVMRHVQEKVSNLIDELQREAP